MDGKIYELLLGAPPVQSVEDVVRIFKATLNGLSRTGYMRAKKIGVECEYVDYSEVVEKKGLICSICNQSTQYGPGRLKGSLAFDHRVAINNGGAHIFENIFPSHSGCNLSKSDDLVDENQQFFDKENKNALFKQTEFIKQSSHDSLSKAVITENTAENTTQSTQDILNNNVHEVFEYWKSVFKKNAATKLAGVRESKLKARLKEGYSVDDIKKAILNCSQSDYHVQNGYTDLELICRDQVKLDRFISLQKPRVQPAPDYTQNRMAELEREAQLWEQQNARFSN